MLQDPALVLLRYCRTWPFYFQHRHCSFCCMTYKQILSQNYRSFLGLSFRSLSCLIQTFSRLMQNSMNLIRKIVTFLVLEKFSLFHWTCMTQIWQIVLDSWQGLYVQLLSCRLYELFPYFYVLLLLELFFVYLVWARAWTWTCFHFFWSWWKPVDSWSEDGRVVAFDFLFWLGLNSDVGTWTWFFLNFYCINFRI